MPFTTDDLAQHRAKQMGAAASTPAAGSQNDPAAPIRFTLRELMIAVTVIGVLLGMLRALGIIGALLAFLATVLFTWVLYPKWRPRNVGSQQTMFDLLWGVGMPLVCLVYDPFVFKQVVEAQFDPFDAMMTAGQGSASHVYDHGFVVYALLGWQMAFLTVVLVVGESGPRRSAFFAGTLFLGCVLAALVGIVLLPLSLLGAFALGIGSLGFTPLITTFCHGRRCYRAMRAAWQPPHEKRASLLSAAGFVIAVAIPLAFGLGLVGMLRGEAAAINAIRWN